MGKVKNGASNQQKLLQMEDMFLLRIVNNTQGLEVLAPLPENFGVTVGSQFSAPFDAHFIGGGMAKGAALANVGTKLGVSTSRFYSSPEPSEISVDVQFEAYYDAGADVMAPVIKLMLMSLGRSITVDSALDVIEEIIAKADESTAAAARQFLDNMIPEGAEDSTNRIAGFLGFVEGPPMVTMQFGNALRLEKVYISSVAPQFSNILDSNGFPMSATCSITAVMQRDPILDENETFDSFWVGGRNYL